jgi:hypothetical protein
VGEVEAAGRGVGWGCHRWKVKEVASCCHCHQEMVVESECCSHSLRGKGALGWSCFHCQGMVVGRAWYHQRVGMVAERSQCHSRFLVKGVGRWWCCLVGVERIGRC